MAADPSKDRPKNREVEDENIRRGSGTDAPPRPATEPRGAKGSEQSPKTATDPGSGEAKGGR
jgi:hypothetical protein